MYRKLYRNIVSIIALNIEARQYNIKINLAISCSRTYVSAHKLHDTIKLDYCQKKTSLSKYSIKSEKKHSIVHTNFYEQKNPQFIHAKILYKLQPLAKQANSRLSSPRCRTRREILPRAALGGSGPKCVYPAHETTTIYAYAHGAARRSYIYTSSFSCVSLYLALINRINFLRRKKRDLRSILALYFSPL